MENEIIDPNLEQSILWRRFLNLRLSYQRAMIREVKITLLGAFISCALVFASGLITKRKERLSALELMFIALGNFGIRIFMEYFWHEQDVNYIPAAQSICLKFELVKLSANIVLLSTSLAILAQLSKKFLTDSLSPSYYSNKISPPRPWKASPRFDIILFLFVMAESSLDRATEIILVFIANHV